MRRGPLVNAMSTNVAELSDTGDNSGRKDAPVLPANPILLITGNNAKS